MILRTASRSTSNSNQISAVKPASDVSLIRRKRLSRRIRSCSGLNIHGLRALPCQDCASMCWANFLPM